MKFLYLMASLALLAACGAPVEVQAPFDAREVAYISSRGPATVSGQAFMRQNGGGVVTCAGETVHLIPAGAYTKEFMTKAFRSPQGGRIPAIMAFQTDHPAEYGRLQRRTTCDAEGDFEFQGVANGEYYVTSVVLWQVGDSFIPEGGALAKYVRVSNGNSQRVLLN